MKWSITIILFLSLLLAGCSDVNVTLPKALFAEMTEEEIKNYNDKQGFNKVTINDNDTVTFNMSQEKHEEILFGIEKDINETLKSIPKNEKSFITSITANNDYDQFTLVSEQSKFDESFAAYTELSILMNAYSYHFFAGKDENDIQVQFIYEDPTNKKQYHIETYPKQE